MTNRMLPSKYFGVLQRKNASSPFECVSHRDEDISFDEEQRMEGLRPVHRVPSFSKIRAFYKACTTRCRARMSHDSADTIHRTFTRTQKWRASASSCLSFTLRNSLRPLVAS
jgi:hypothetical protein